MLSLVLRRNGVRYWAEPLVQVTLTEPALLPFLLSLRATVRRGGSHSLCLLGVKTGEDSQARFAPPC